jgi:hypothetical protein
MGIYRLLFFFIALLITTCEVLAFAHVTAGVT